MRSGTRCIGHITPLVVIFVNLYSIQSADGLHRLRANRGSGCADGTTEALQDDRHPTIAACSGSWRGHVRGADVLCAPGWKVCSWQNHELLQTITWSDATSMSGCYAINAAQDGGQCRPCIDEVEQDDLAGVGKGCPHQSFGQKSCITGGQIDASCCIDTHFNRSCTYRPGLVTGAVCCRLPGVPPQILVEPKSLTHVVSGSTFVLSCQAIGSPIPTVAWYKDGFVLPGNEPRIAVFQSGYIVVSEARPSDTGIFQCVASNSIGNDSVDAKVIVSEHNSGCQDGTSDGLHQYEDIQACKGRWVGHVKRGRHLCAKGWKVCTSRDRSLLTMLTWDDATRLKGCYAYNAENSLNQCDRCHRGDTMAGIGAHCGRIQRNQPSCLAQGRIDTFRTKDKVSDGCAYREGHVTGVVCCRSRHRKSSPYYWNKPKCSPRCINGGTCVARNRCSCAQGYKGAWCQNAICPGGCIHNATCIRPGVCRCRNGYSGEKCKRRKDTCLFPCMYGGRCKQGKCKCPSAHYGAYCQHTLRWHSLSEDNRTER